MFQLILPFQLELPFEAAGPATTRSGGAGSSGSRVRTPRPKRPRVERPRCVSMELFLDTSGRSAPRRPGRAVESDV